MNILWNICALFFAVAPQDYPDHVGVVNDFANEIDPGTKAKIELVIADVKAKADVRLVVVTVTSLGGKSVEDYTIGLTKKWGVGQKGKNNGILFLHAPKERKIRIENGYGVESRLTDIESKMIIEQTIIPLMKANKFSEAMLRGSEQILKVLSAPEKQPEKQSVPVAQVTKGEGIGFGGIIMIVGLVVVILILVFVFAMGGEGVRSPPRREPMRYTPSSRPIEPPSIFPMDPLATGAVLGTMLGSEGPPGLQGDIGLRGPQGVAGSPGPTWPTPPAIPTTPVETSVAAAYLEARRRRDEEEERRRRRDEEEERRRRKRRQEEDEEEDNRRRRSSYDSSSSSSSSSDSGSSSGGDSFSGGDSGGGGASGSY